MYKDSILWIIGANSDIAQCFVKRYQNSFKTIVLASRNTVLLSENSRRIGAKNIQEYYIDLSNSESITNFICKAPEPDGIIICAGYLNLINGEEDTDYFSISHTIQANYEGPVKLLESVLPRLINKTGSFVLSLSSAAVIRGKYSNRFYTSSKSAFATYFEGLSQKYSNSCIRLFLLKLGHINTKMLNQLQGSRKSYAVASPEETADYIWKLIHSHKGKNVYFKKIWRLFAYVYRLLPLFIMNNLSI